MGFGLGSITSLVGDPLGFIGGGGGGNTGGNSQGGIGNSQESTNATQDSHDTILGNAAMQATGQGIINVTDAGATKAALESNASVLSQALSAMAGVSGAAINSAAYTATTGGGGGGMSAAPAPAPGGINRNTLLIIAAAILAALLFFRRK